VAKLCFALVLLPVQWALAEEARPHDKVSFYFAAHQDDWQLFMNPSAFLDVGDGRTKTVFVHMTAGDAGLGIGMAGRKHPFYLARENGADSAIRFMADAENLPVERSALLSEFNGHRIYRVSYRNTVAYYLRVPDGNPNGTGYPDTGFQSLRLLASGTIPSLTSIDGSTAYAGWGDLVATLRAIMDFERGRAPSVQLNVAELDERINPNDHSDHLMTARAALDAASGLACARRVHYVNYASSRLPQNLDSERRDMESSVFAVTAAGVRALDHGSSWQWYDRSYVGRNYFRIQEGAGRCDERTVAVPAPAPRETLVASGGKGK
jgi:hypothetical protein